MKSGRSMREQEVKAMAVTASKKNSAVAVMLKTNRRNKKSRKISNCTTTKRLNSS